MTFHITDFSTEVLSNVQIKKQKQKKLQKNPLNILFSHTLLYDLTQIAL